MAGRSFHLAMHRYESPQAVVRPPEVVGVALSAPRPASGWCDAGHDQLHLAAHALGVERAMRSGSRLRPSRPTMHRPSGNGWQVGRGPTDQVRVGGHRPLAIFYGGWSYGRAAGRVCRAREREETRGQACAAHRPSDYATSSKTVEDPAPIYATRCMFAQCVRLTSSMSLAHALLTSLLEQPFVRLRSARRFDKSIGPFLAGHAPADLPRARPHGEVGLDPLRRRPDAGRTRKPQLQRAAGRALLES